MQSIDVLPLSWLRSFDVLSAQSAKSADSIKPAPKQLNDQLFSTPLKKNAGTCPSFFFNGFAADGRGKHVDTCLRY